MVFSAHIKLLKTGDMTVQTVAEHCRASAEYAAALAGASLHHSAYLCGLLHDMGKYTVAFEAYINRAARGEKVVRGTVNHTFAGVRFVLERWHGDKQTLLDKLTSELIAIAIGGHHGLFDCIGEDGTDGYLHRMKTALPEYAQTVERFMSHCTDGDELDMLFEKVVAEIDAITQKLRVLCRDQQEMSFQLSLLARLLSSCVIDADRRDTACFMDGVQWDVRGGCLWVQYLDRVEAKLQAMSCDEEINRVRRMISDQCRSAAQLETGVYHLEVPTGGGKTLSSLRYALAAAMIHGKSRIFFVIPLLSVLEQNAQVIREAVEDDGIVLEHHSNLVRDHQETEAMQKWTLLTETWEAPMVITTLVQLLNTLFSGKTSCVRRMNALYNSVIVIDEVQSVPTKMLSLFSQAINFLSKALNATIVLSSATQPAWDYMRHPICFTETRSLIAHDAEQWKVFDRTQIIDQTQPYSYETLAAFALEQLDMHDSVLVICNTKRQASTLFGLVENAADADAFHLSTNMCMAHRIQTLNIMKPLLGKKRVITISTQLIEAGVDISFACVVRIEAGLENVIQSAGRCNRSGEFGRKCPVYIVRLKEENLSHLKDIRAAQQALSHVLRTQAAGSNLNDPANVEAYYRRLYTDMADNAQDYPLKSLPSLFELLGTNAAFYSKGKGKRSHYVMLQAFRKAGEAFRVFDDNTVDVIVPYGGGENLITDLLSEKAQWDMAYVAAKLKEAKPFTVSLYEHSVRALEKEKGIVSLLDGRVLALQSAYYSPKIGFSLAGDNINLWED